MKEFYLEVTFHRGIPMAAYLYLPRKAGAKSHRTSREDPGMIIDFDQNDQPLGIEITAPSIITAEAINRVLHHLGLPHIQEEELAPLQSAA